MDTPRQDPGGPALPWPAPQAGGPLRARLRVPGSKSMTNRALVLAALAAGPTDILSPLEARDTRLMAGALRALGATVATEGPAWRVSPGWTSRDARVDVGNAGTVMRFVPPVSALASVDTEFHGDPRASQRPVGAIIAALREIGAVIDDGGRGAIPFTVHGTGSLAGGAVTVDASASSQLVSGLLLAAPRYDKGLEVRHRGGRAPSAPHIEMTVQMLREAGARVETASGRRDGPGRRPRYLVRAPRRAARPPDHRPARCGQLDAVPGRGHGRRGKRDHPRLAGGDRPARRPHPARAARHGGRHRGWAPTG